MLSADPLLSELAGGVGSSVTMSAPYYTSPPPPPNTGGGGSAANAEETSIPLEQTFFLHSLPGASKTIYLDFDGHLTRETQWNTDFHLPNIITPAYDTDGDITTFSDDELIDIQLVWQQVAEDFLPFEVNVTTQDPGVEALRNSGGDDTAWGQRVLIGGSDNDWFDPATPLSAGGVSYGSFPWDSDTPNFAFAGDFGSGAAADIAEVISHEVGHSLGLAHDSQFRFYENIEEDPPELVRLFDQYYAGHGNGTTSWAPIMGVGYGQSLTQWSKGEYFNATNSSDGTGTLQDDLEIITNRGGANGNGFGYRTDDHGSTIGTASTLGIQSDEVDLVTLFSEGIIEQNTDIDYFEFIVEGLGEVVTLDINPFAVGPNLDILAKLFNESGSLLATSNPLDDILAGGQSFGAASDGGWHDEGNVAWFGALNGEYTDQLLLQPGVYYVTVEGTGRPLTFLDPTFHPGPFQTAGNPPDPPLPPDMSDWGYSDYGSLGYYSISGTRTKGLVVGVDFDAPGGASPQGWTTFSGGGSQTVLTGLTSEIGAITPYQLTILTSGTIIEGFASQTPIDSAALPGHGLPLDELSGYLGGGGDDWTLVWSNLEPGQVYQIYVFGHADIEAQNNIEIVGGEWNGITQTHNFTQEISPDSLLVNDAPPSNSALPPVALFAIADENGEVTINVSNELGFAAALGGMAIAPTKPGIIQGRKWDDQNGNGIDDGEPGLPGWNVYLDLNNNGQLDLISTEDEQIVTVAPNVPQAINDYSTVKNELVFDGFGQILDVDVTIDITHQFVADLELFLVSPEGTRVKLVDDRGGFGQNFTNTVFDDAALTPITSITPADAPFTGSYRPMEPLSVFNGENSFGTWTLEITDDAAGEIGVLNGWSIKVTIQGVDLFVEPNTLTDANGNYSFTNLPPGLYHVREHFLEQQLLDGWKQTAEPGSITVRSGATVTGVDFANWIPTNVPGSISGEKWNDLNGDGVQDAEEPGLADFIIYIDSNNNGARDVATEPTTIAATDLPKPIVDFSPTNSQIAFANLGTVLDVEVTLDITHSFMGDLDAFLISPSGRRVELFTGVGGQYNDFANLTLSDSAAESIATIGLENVPYTGTWQPEGRLSDFFGEDAMGNWTLEIRDTAQFDEGMLTGWSLTITVGERFTTTDENGAYIFENLPAGQYIVREEQRFGWQQTFPEPPNTSWVINVGLGETVTGANFGNESAVALFGDYNLNGVVDAADYVLWRKTMAAAANPPYSGADGNGSGTIDDGDYGVWSSNFGATLPGGSGAGSGAAEAATTDTGAALVASSEESISSEPVSEPITLSLSQAPTETDTSQTSAPRAAFVSSPASTLDSSQDGDAIGGGSAASVQTSDSALMAWLVSLDEGDEANNESAAARPDYAAWHDDSLDSFDSVDSVFEVLGVGA